MPAYFPLPASPFPGSPTRTAYTPSGGSSLRGSGDVRLIVGTPMVRPRPAPRSTTARRLYARRSEEHTSELQSQSNFVCRLLLEKKKTIAVFYHPQDTTSNDI